MTLPKSNVVYDKLTRLIGVINPEAFDKLVLLQELHFKQIAAMVATNKVRWENTKNKPKTLINDK